LAHLREFVAIISGIIHSFAMNNVCGIEEIQRAAVSKFYDGEIDGIAEVAGMDRLCLERKGNYRTFLNNTISNPKLEH